MNQSLFRRIVDHAMRHNEFYRGWITDPDSPPVLDRKTFLKHNTRILNGLQWTDTTSGSTGVPVKFFHSPDWIRRTLMDSARLAHTLGGTVPTISIVDPAFRQPSTQRADVFASPSEQINAIVRTHSEFGCVAIVTYPTNAERLALELLKSGSSLDFITRFGMFGETVDSHVHGLVARAFPNARVWTSYSSKEFGIIASTCVRDSRFHHINSHRLGIEILRDDGRPATDHEIGRVIVTDYYNQFSPFIRYDIGDLASVGRCPCGRHSFAEILGKERGMLKLRDGSKMSHLGLFASFREIHLLSQCRVVQNSAEEITVLAVGSKDTRPAIEEAVCRELGYRPQNLVVTYVDGIPRTANGKFPLVVSS